MRIRTQPFISMPIRIGILFMAFEMKAKLVNKDAPDIRLARYPAFYIYGTMTSRRLSKKPDIQPNMQIGRSQRRQKFFFKIEIQMYSCLKSKKKIRV